MTSFLGQKVLILKSKKLFFSISQGLISLATGVLGSFVITTALALPRSVHRDAVADHLEGVMIASVKFN